MKTLLIATILIAFHYNLIAQRPDFSLLCKEEMNKLSYLIGDWRGTANVKSQNGAQVMDQTEHISWNLDGLIISIEGVGTEQGKIGFHAFAVLSFDPFAKRYKFRTFVKEGYTTDAYFLLLDDNKFEWGFDIPTGGKTKYTITLNPKNKTWYEKGEYAPDGATWTTFIEMNLVKQ